MLQFVIFFILLVVVALLGILNKLSDNPSSTVNSNYTIPDNNRYTIKEKKYTKDYTYVPNISKITDNIWISNYETSKDYELLKSLGIKQILTLGIELPNHNTNDFRLVHIRIKDSPDANIKKHFNDTFDFISDTPTLVHCAAGVSRSVSIVIAYLIKKNHITFDEAYVLVKSKRHIARPNNGFINQLRLYEKECIG